jgi:hypothetical protein
MTADTGTVDVERATRPCRHVGEELRRTEVRRCTLKRALHNAAIRGGICFAFRNQRHKDKSARKPTLQP